MEYAQNTFEGGIVMDYNVGTVPDNILTDALNATMSTFNGNEQLLQNDMGNAKITYRTCRTEWGFRQYRSCQL